MSWKSSSVSTSERLLCISGTYGCGKTVLASSIIEYLKVNQAQTLFYYFSGRDANLKQVDGLIRTLLWQLLDGIATDSQSVDVANRLVQRGPTTTPELLEALQEVLSLRNQPVYCIVDGVDEIDGDESPQPLLYIVVQMLNANPDFRAVLLGRQYVLQASVLEATIGSSPPIIEMIPTMVNDDIGAFISAEMEENIASNLIGPRESRDYIVRLLKEKSDGIFLWIKLMIKDLNMSASPSELIERLHSAPGKLEDIYRSLFLRLIKRLDKFQLKLARTILAFAITSCRALEVDELRYVYAMDSGSGFTFKGRLMLELPKRILDVCGDFITIRNGYLQLVHYSIQEFLIRPLDQWQCNEDKDLLYFRVDSQASHLTLGTACLDYLEICNFICPFSNTAAFRDLKIHYPFLNYASIYMLSHLGTSGPPHPDLIQSISRFLGTASCVSWIEYLAILVLEDGSFYRLADEIKRFQTWLDQGNGSLESELQECLDRELENRHKVLGERNPRTEQWQLISAIINGTLKDANTDEGPAFELESFTDLRLYDAEGANVDSTYEYDKKTGEDDTEIWPLAASHDRQVNLRNVLDGIKKPLAFHQQVQMLFQLQLRLEKVKALTDPVKILLRLVLQKAPMVPVYMLLFIAEFYCSFKKLDEALEVYYAALKKVETQQTPIKFDIFLNISFVLIQQQRYEEAEMVERRAITEATRLLKQEHPTTLSTMYNLGLSLYLQRRYVEAEDIQQQTLHLRQKVLGREHPKSLESMYILGKSFYRQGKCIEAEEIHRRALQLRQKVLGKEHKDTLLSMHDLGVSLHLQDKYAEAEKIYRETLIFQEKVSGKYNNDLLVTLVNNLGLSISKQGRNLEAEGIFRKSLHLREKVLGKENRDTICTMVDLANSLMWQRKYVEAEEVYQMLRLRKISLANKDQDVLNRIDELRISLQGRIGLSDTDTVGKHGDEVRRGVVLALPRSQSV